jgi:proteasome lid subunit RPN8/RPN11
MKIKGIAADTLNLLLTMGHESHPREFAALLEAEDGIIRNIDIIPGTISGSESASVIFEMIPLNLGHIGSAHSHPNGVIRPSEADISFFSRTGSCHIIIGYPYEPDCWGCFRSDGTPIELDVIEDA